MRAFAVSMTVLLTSLLCSCGVTESVRTETVWKDTLVTLERPAIVDTFELHEVTHVEVPGGVNADTCVTLGKGKSGIEVRISKRGGRTVARVRVPADTTHKAVKVPGALTQATRRQISWLEQMVDDLPSWAIITALILSTSLLIYMLKK